MKALGRRPELVALGSVFIGVALVLGKLTVGLLTGSLGIISEATVHVHRVPEERVILGYLLPTWPVSLDVMRELAASEAAPSVTRVSDPPETAFSFATRKTPTLLDRVKSRALQALRPWLGRHRAPAQRVRQHRQALRRP